MKIENTFVTIRLGSHTWEHDTPHSRHIAYGPTDTLCLENGKKKTEFILSQIYVTIDTFTGR